MSGIIPSSIEVKKTAIFNYIIGAYDAEVSYTEQWGLIVIVTLAVIGFLVYKFRRNRQMLSRLSKKEQTQWQLDKIAYRHGSSHIIRTSLWVTVLLVSTAMLFVKAKPWYITTGLAILSPVSLWRLIQVWRQKFLSKPCPNCGGKLRITRTLMKFTNTVISCDQCKMQSDHAQYEEDSGYGM